MISREKLKYFADLSTYETDFGLAIPGVLNIGWLGARSDFKKGEAPKDFVDKLKRLINASSSDSLKLVMGIWRGTFNCPLCSIGNNDIQKNWEIQEEIANLGNAEIWIPSCHRKGVYYSSSTWLCHYIIDHQYLPPAEYIESVLSVNEATKINANIIAFDLEIKFNSLKSGIPIDQEYVADMHEFLER
jgi:hypothetical protein